MPLIWLGTVNKLSKHTCPHCELRFKLFKKRKTSSKLTGGYVIFYYNMSLYNRGHFS